ncbi:hypothetical protein [Vibrio vulnificus]|nr:hypothetical protein [Vibrio vulnificus]MCA0767600.1 hypothetical protein [Vibrio vulnificus]MDT9658379.1 hypothetical protein [Vibrio vulnificus]HDY7488447.1 hypothetical protein [Vibrio vulnificus]HDY7558072.1 hypothetical protein [Vibrio vulnificus]HDY7617300.1 hypothetical protein [Vibrio vulnificus]
MNKPIASCLWQATLRLKTLVITASRLGDRTLLVFGGDAEGESHGQY